MLITESLVNETSTFDIHLLYEKSKKVKYILTSKFQIDDRCNALESRELLYALLIGIFYH